MQEVQRKGTAALLDENQVPTMADAAAPASSEKLSFFNSIKPGGFAIHWPTSPLVVDAHTHTLSLNLSLPHTIPSRDVDGWIY